MKLSLKNIGKISTASIEINGITVIAGENNTGKSTIGRTLFSIFNSFYKIDEQIYKVRIEGVKNILNFTYQESLFNRVNLKDIAIDIVKEIENYRNNKKALKDKFLKTIQCNDEFVKHFNDTNIDDIIARIVDTLKVSDNDILKSILEKRLNVEFNGQISNIFLEDTGKMQLQIQKEIIEIEISGTNITNIQNMIALSTEAIYLDDPFVVDESKVYFWDISSEYTNHREHLREKLIYSKRTNIMHEIVINNKLESIYKKLDSICSGSIVKNKHTGLGYRRTNTEKVLDVRNLSTGLKTFIILKQLLLNGVIDYNGTIILDEPEIHLHPQWQLLFAEIIVLIHKEFNMHILLNTHSPYFLRAIQVYSAKYQVADMCKYYLSETIGEQAKISDVTNNIEKIYSKLSQPLQHLEDMRWQDD